MTDAAQALFDEWLAMVWPFAVVFLRIGAAMALLPGLGEHVVPARVRLAISIALSVAVGPAVAAALPGPDGRLLLLLAGETLIGLSLGLVLRCTVLAVEMAGSWAAQAMSLSQMFGTAGEPMPAMAHLLTMAALALAMMGGLHVRLAAALVLSYDALPAGQIPGAALVRAWGQGHLAQAFGLAFSLSAPFAIAALLYNVALGAINRAMPALMVSLISAPALAGGALVLLAVLAPALLGVWWHEAGALLDDPFGVPR